MDVDGLTKKVSISDELCAFMNVPNGTLESRLNVNNAVIQYIKEHDLMPTGTKITLDSTLKTLFSCNDESMEIFAILTQKMKHHFE